MGKSPRMHGPPKAVCPHGNCTCSLQVKKILDMKHENTGYTWALCPHVITLF